MPEATPSKAPARGPGRQARVGMRAVLGALCLFVAGCATTDAPWPDKVVDAQRLQVVGRLHVARPIRNLSDPVAGGTTVLRLHIDAQGRVRRTEIAESSGDAGVDAAAVRGLSGATFVPYQEAGVPVAVTTLMPIHFKAPSRCRGLRPLDC